jgi:predicted transcriptional regulator of viral defense system
MQTLTTQLIDAGLSERILTDGQLSRLLNGSNQRRYNLVNRAMKAGELIRLRRGLYMLPDKFRKAACHPYALAQMLVPGSYVSMETALSFHGWIPEAVYATASIVPGRKSKDFNHQQMGLFTYHPLAIQKGHFLEMVERVILGEQAMLMASPMRALMDLVCFKKLEWQGLRWFEHSMRIDEEHLAGVTGAQLRTLKQVYKHKRMQLYLLELEKALGLALSAG